MNDKPKDSDQPPADAASLRQRAEAQLRSIVSPALSTQSPEAIQQLLHELQVHQIELEMQNEELRTAQEVIEAARARYFDLYELAPAGYCTVSEKGLILEANLTAATLLGTARSALQKQPLSRFILKEDQNIYYLHRKKLLATGEAQECDLRLVRPDGTHFWAHLAGIAAQADDGAPVCRVTLSDITARKQAELASRANETRLIDAQAVTKTGSWETDLSSLRVVWSAQTYTIFGVDPSTFQASHPAFLEFVHPQDRGIVDEAFRKSFESSATNTIEHRIVTATGITKWVEERWRIERDDQGNPLRAVGTCQDITERKLTEEKMRASEARLKLAVNAGHIGVWDWDVVNDRAFWADNMYDMYGIRKEDFNGAYDTWTKTLHPDDREAIDAEIQAALNGKRELALEFRIISGDGSIKFIRSASQTTYDASGKAVRIIGVNIDISARRQAELALKASNAQLQLLETCVSRLNDIVLITEAEPTGEPGPRIVFVNDTFVRRTGYSREEVIGKSPRLLQGPKTDRKELDRIRAALERWEPVRAELLNYTKSGVEFWLELDIVPVADATGWFTHWIAVERDVTERKQTSEALRHNQALLADSEKIGRVGGWEIDIQTRLTTWTEGVYDIYELDGTDRLTVDQGINYYTPASRPMIAQAVQRAIEQGEPFDLELEIITAKGNRRSVHVVGKPDRARGKVTGFFQDITEQKQSEAKRAHLEAQLAQAQKLESLGTLAGGVAHDFNNILAVILGNTELLRLDVGPADPALQSLDEIDKASRRARNLVQQILAFGRRRVMDRKVISLEPMVQQATQLLRATIPAGVRLELVCAPDTPRVLAEATQIEQILINLGTNAWHATEDQERAGLIQISLEAEAHDGLRFAVLTVRDNGCGMDEATRSRIYEPFFTTKPVDKGTGLGMSVVFGIVQSHSAEIEVQSVPGAGTAFVIRFAAAEAPAQIAPADDTAARKPLTLRAEGKHVLYVDDEESVVSVMTRLLGRHGYRVSGYSDPGEALAAVSADPAQFDIVVTDYNMPLMSGLDVARRLREIRADLPVLLITGHITEKLQRDAPEAGVRELIYKPRTVEDLCAAVARYANVLTVEEKPTSS